MHRLGGTARREVRPTISRSPTDSAHATHFDDCDFIRTTITDIFAPHDLDVTRGSVLDGSFRLGASDSLKLVWLSYGAPVSIDAPPLEHPLHLIQIPLRGRALVTSGGDQVISDSAIASIPDPRLGTSMRWEANCSQMILRFEEDVLQREVESMLGYPIKAPIRFTLGMQLDSRPARSWRAAVNLLATEIQHGGGLLESPLATSRLESFILAGLLTAQPHNYTSALDADQRPAPSRAVRHAMECIEEHPAQALTTAQLAASAGVSTRALQRGFREQVGCSPMTYLRTVRLKRARDALAAADAASGLTVTDVALEWGFMHLGRFSAEYRRHFGQTPSQTLRQ